jgi:hypothetical protein
VIGDEARVVDAFCTYLRMNGWEVRRELDFVDVAATRNGITLLAEAKGRTASPGLDVDTLYGQLLRRIPGDAIGSAVLAVVVPDVAVKFATRVSLAVRGALGMHVYAVDEGGAVPHLGDGDPITV